MTERAERWTIYRKSNGPWRAALAKQDAAVAVKGPDTDWIDVVSASHAADLERELASGERHFTIGLRSAEKAQDNAEVRAEQAEARAREAAALLCTDGDGNWLHEPPILHGDGNVYNRVGTAWNILSGYYERQRLTLEDGEGE